MDGTWYCLFCTSATNGPTRPARTNPQTPVTGTHYLIADHPRGPWRIPPGPFLDGAEPCRRYAARIVQTPDGLVILGFADGGKDKFGGYVMDPEPVTVGPDGLLTVTPSQSRGVDHGRHHPQGPQEILRTAPMSSRASTSPSRTASSSSLSARRAAANPPCCA